MTLLIVGIILLFIASSYFSGSETALTATNEMKLQLKAANGDKKAERLLKLVNNPDLFIPGILIANNVPNIVLPSLVTIVALEYEWNLAITTAILTVLIIIFAEVMPKSVAAAFPERIAHIVYYPTMIILQILKPFIWALNLLTRTTIKLLGQDDGKQITISKAKMRAMVDIAHTEGTFKSDEMSRLKSVLDFKSLNIADVLKTHRIDMQSLSIHTTYEEAYEFVLSNRYTRYPIYDKDVDHLVGVFHSKAMLAWAQNPEKSIREYADMDPLYVFEFNSIDVVFKRMMQEQKHIAIVLDEYGGTEGLITHEDLIETMIGQDIEDELDEHNSLIIKNTGTKIVCDAKLSLHQLNNVFQTNIPEDADSLAGFILTMFNYLPQTGDAFTYENLEFKILSANERKINLVEINKKEDVS
ncbi:hemolysin family protein [Oceanobacillus sp. CAU 1775]